MHRRINPLKFWYRMMAPRTTRWSVIQKLCEKYKGPHRVRCRREPQRVGTLGHVLHAAEQASGDLLVLAAGDDISYPHRVSSIVAGWKETNAAAFSSRHDTIDPDGTILQLDLPGIAGAQIRSWTGLPLDQPLVKGCTSAFSRSFLLSIPVPESAILHEDLAANLWLMARNEKCARVEESLVAYRRHGAAVSFRSPSKRYSRILEEVLEGDRPLRQYAALYRYLLEKQIPGFLDADIGSRASDGIAASLRNCEQKRAILSGGVFTRLKLALGSVDSSVRNFAIRRLAGPHLLAGQRWLWRRLMDNLPGK